MDLDLIPSFRGWVAGYGVRRLADEIGVERSSVYHWMTGRFWPRREHATRILDISGERAMRLPGIVLTRDAQEGGESR